MIKFNVLWKNFPEKSSIRAKCQNKQKTSSSPFGNYCAINLSEALIKSGVSTAGSKATKCWGHSGLFSLIGQDHIVDSLLKGKDIYKMTKILKLIRGASMACLGLGTGYFSAGIF